MIRIIEKKNSFPGVKLPITKLNNSPNNIYMKMLFVANDK